MQYTFVLYLTWQLWIGGSHGVGGAQGGMGAGVCREVQTDNDGWMDGWVVGRQWRCDFVPRHLGSLFPFVPSLASTKHMEALPLGLRGRWGV